MSTASLSIYRPVVLSHTSIQDKIPVSRAEDSWRPSMSSSGSQSRPPPPPGLYTNKVVSNKPTAQYPRDTSLDMASFAFHSSPPLHHQQQRPIPSLAGPSAMPAYTQLGSAQMSDPISAAVGRSPSPTKRTFNFPIGDPSERWNSIGQAAQLVPPSGSRNDTVRKHSVAASAAEPFLGYNELFSSNGVHMLSTSDLSKSVQSASLSTSDPMNAAFGSSMGHDSRGFTLSSNQEQDAFASRFGGSSAFTSVHEDSSYSVAGSAGPRIDDFAARPNFTATSASGMPLAAGNMSPRSLMHYQQIQAQQSMSSHAGLQGAQGNTLNSSGAAGPLSSMEEITTVFIVGFPDDMTEREFANMFLFAKGFEASTLKVPVGFGQPGPSGRVDNGALPAGPGGPYQAVNMAASNVYDASSGGGGGSWEDSMTRANANDAFASLANTGNVGGANAAAGGKIKQIIGFAKFRTRMEALEARDALNGRKIDVEKGCVLKTEMAKKNLHTKQRLGPLGPNDNIGPLPSIGPNRPLSPMGHSAHVPIFGTAGPFEPRSGPPPPGVSGVGMPPFGSFASNKGAYQFDSVVNQAKPSTGGSGTPADLISPQEVYGGGTDFLGQGLPSGVRTTAGGNDLRTSGHHVPSNSEKWGPSTGPLDYYAPETNHAGPGRQSISGPNAGSNPQQQSRPDWTAVGSPPGLHAVNAGGRSALHSQAARGALSEFERGGAQGWGPASSVASRTESTGAPLSGPSSSSDLQQQPQSDTSASIASRMGQLAVGSPTFEDAPGATSQAPAGRSMTSSNLPPNRVSSPDLPSPTGRNVVGDNHPPVNTLFVGNLPSNASSTALSQLEDQMRALFGSRRGFRQLSFRLKSNGPMCFVEFDDVHTAGKAMSELNGNTLNGSIKNGGIRLSFSKNPLFRMNSSGGIGGSGTL